MNATNETGRRRPRPIRSIFAILLIIILIVMLGPVLIGLLAAMITNGFGCGLDEGSAHACIIAGADRGDILYAMGMMPWLALFTLPLGAVALLVWLVALIVTLFIRRRAASRSGS